MSDDLAPATRAIAAGRGAHRPGTPVNPPVVFSSIYRNGADLEYARDGNPTWAALEEVLGTLDGGEALAFASGIAAIAAVLDELPIGAHVVAPGDGYSGLRMLLDDLVGRGRLTWEGVDIADTAAVEGRLDAADLLWIESPTNPLLAIADIDRLCSAARAAGVRSAVDATFATPLNLRPLARGADVVVHSATKLLAGHSDVLMGAVVATDTAVVDRLRTRRQLGGAVPGPMEAFLALRGIRSLPARLDVAQRTAATLADRLAEHPAVERVRYPGRGDHPQHALAAAQLDGFGTVISFEVVGGLAAADRVAASVALIEHATSLGGVETTLERRGRYGAEAHLPPGLIRMSVGCEHVEDLWTDLRAALEAA